MKKVKRALALALALSTVMVSACGSTTDSASNEPEKKTDTTENVAAENGDKVELRFLLWGNQEEIDKKTEWTDKFNEENDRIHVSLEAIPEGFHDKLTVQISSGTLADLVQIAGDFGGVYFKEGLFVPLDSYIEKDGLPGCMGRYINDRIII